MDSNGNIHHLSYEENEEMLKRQKDIADKDVADKFKDIADKFKALTIKPNDPVMGINESDIRKVTKMNKEVRKGWMRNQPCICGSGKKFKNCCWNKANPKEN